MFSNIGAKIKNVTLLSHFLRRSREKGFQIKFMKAFIGGQTASAEMGLSFLAYNLIRATNMAGIIKLLEAM